MQSYKNHLLKLTGILSLLLAWSGEMRAAVTITAASGGAAISADKAGSGPAPAWTSLGGITIAEGNNGDFATGTNVTLVLKAPAGFEFNTGVTPNVSFTAGHNISSAAVAVTDASTLTLTLTVTNNNASDSITIGGTTAIQVRPTAGTPLAAGNHIYRPSSGGGTATINGITTSADGSAGSNFGNLSEVAGTATQLAFTTQPGNATAGTVFGIGPTVKTEDQFGNFSTNGLGTTVNATMSLTAGLGPLQGTTVTNIGTGGGKGTATLTTLRIDAAGTDKQLTANAPGLSNGVSSVFTVGPGAFNRLQILVPGEAAAPGTVSGKTGAPMGQEAGRGFYVTVNAVDTNWNVINTNDVIRLSSTDTNASLPASAALVAGSRVFGVTLATVGTATMTASNLTHSTIAASTSAAITVSASSLRGGPVVAIHDSELTRALETLPASNPGTPTGPGTSGFEWWPTNWHYFVMPEALKEALRADGTSFEVVSDADITAGRLMTNGLPRYPIVISLASEAVRDDELGPLTNYVAAGGTLLVGSSAFTRQPNGAGRGDFALASQMGLHSVATNLQNWSSNTIFGKSIEHRLTTHIPFGTLNWRMPMAADETSWGTSPAHSLPPFSLAWQVQPSDATLLAQGSTSPYITVKQYGAGNFIYHAGMQPLVGHGGWAPGMYAYGIFRNAIEWAFSRMKNPVARVSAWPYPYDAARTVRHDLEDYQSMISAIESSAQFEATNGVKGDYFFCTGTLRVEMTNSPAVVASLRRAVTNYGATIGPHNGGFTNPNNTNLITSDYDFWHWGPDEALDLTPAGYGNGKAYAIASVSDSFGDVEGWLSGITNGTRIWVAPYFNATREASYDLQAQLGIKVTGEQKLTPFPHWTLSTQTSGKRYPMLTLPVSDWYVSSDIGQSAEAGHTSATVHALVDYYYNLGALINLYSHSSSDGTGGAGLLVQDYILYGNSKPRLWSTNALGIYNWWLQRSGLQLSPTMTTSSNQTFVRLNVFGATDPQDSVDVVVPSTFSGLQVFTNGVAAAGNSFRTNGQLVRVNVGTAVTNAEVRYLIFPISQGEAYTAVAGSTMTIAAPGVLANDTVGLGTNPNAILVTGPTHGTLSLNPDGSFSYTPNTNYSGVDSFTYKANDGTADGQPATVTLNVTPSASVLFSDDFTRDTDPGPLLPWILQTGNWAVTGGQLNGGTNAPSSGYGFIYLNNTWTNYAVEGRLRFSSTSAYGGGLGGRLNQTSGAHYAAWIYPENSPSGSHVMRLVKFQNWNTFGYNGTNSIPMQQVTLPSVGTNWHSVKLAFSGNQITVFWDGTQMMSVTDTDLQPYLTGGISVDMWTDSTPYVMSVDNVIVTAPTLDQAITFNQPSDHVYGDTFAAGATASSGLPVTLAVLSGPATVSGDIISVTGPGSVTIRASQSGDSNYKAAPPVDRSFTVNRATLTVTADNKSKVYGASVPALTASYSGFVNGETIAVVSGSPVLSAAVSNGSPAGIYPINIGSGTLAAANYNFQFVNGQMTVTQAPLTVTVNNASRTYGQANPPFTATYGGFVNGDDASVLSGNAALTTSATVTSPAGIYPINASVGSLSSPNYSFNFVNGILTISWATVFADDFTRTNGSLSPWIAQSNNWSIAGGILTGGVNPLFSYGFIYETNSWADYTVQARMQFPVGAFGGGLGGRLDPATGAHYSAWVYPEGSAGGSGVLKLVKFQNWSSFGYNGVAGTVMQQVNLPGVGTNSHTVKISFTGNLITVFYDGAQEISVTDTNAQPYTTGAISLDMWTDSAGYQMNVDDVVATAPPAPQSITFAPLGDRTYGDSAVVLSATASSDLPVSFSVLSGPATLSGNILTLTGAGAVTVRASQSGNSSFSPAINVDQSFTVNPAALVVTADPQTKTYGTTNPLLTGSLSGVQNGDVITASFSTSAGPGNPVGSYTIVAGLNDPGNRLSNYAVTTNNGILTVSAAQLTGTADHKSRLYGQVNPPFTVTYTGFVNGENAGIVTGTLLGSTSADTNSPAGNYPISVSGQSAPNYTITYVDGTLSVLPAALLVQAQDKSRAYGQTNPLFTASITGFVNAEDSSVLGGALALVTTADTNTPVGTYPIEVSGLLSTNYSITFSNGTLTVTPFALSVTASNQSRAYGAVNPTLTGELSGVQNGDNITASYSTSANTNSPMGSYSITPALNDPDSRLGNYTVTTNNGTLTVTHAPLVVTADNQSRSYGAPNPTLTGTLSGVVNGDNITASYSATADTNSPVGNYDIVPALSDPGSKLSNYSIAINNGVLTVTDAYLTGTADHKTRLYGEANPPFTVTYTGFVNGENAGIVTGTLLGSTSADTNSPAGNYPISVSGQSAPNYTITYVDGTLSVLPAALLVQAQDKSRAYGQTNPLFTASITGFVNAEDSSVLGGALAFTTTADTNTPVGAYPIEVSGLLSTNYSLTFSNGTLTVTPFALSVTASNQSRAYGAANPTLTSELTGVQNGDNITASYSTSADTNSPAGTYSIIPALNDPDGKLVNYSVSTNTGTLTVTPATLVVTAADQTRVFSAPNPPLTVSFSGFVNGEDTNALNGAPELDTTVTLNSPVGSYAITVSSGTLTSSNYSFLFVAGTLMVDMADSSSALNSSENPSTQDAAVTFTSVVSATEPATAIPSGDVQFFANGVAMGAAVPLVSGVATLTSSALSAGSNVVEGVYMGNSNFLPSTNSLVQVVNLNVQQPLTLAIHYNGDNTVTITFSGTAGAQYLVQATDSLGGVAWTNVSTNTAGADGTWTYTVSQTGHPQRFFRPAKPISP